MGLEFVDPDLSEPFAPMRRYGKAGIGLRPVMGGQLRQRNGVFELHRKADESVFVALVEPA